MLRIKNNSVIETAYNVSRYLPALMNQLIGRYRRKKGLYDEPTLIYMRSAWEKNPTTRNLLGYLAFCRDLGCIPAPFLLRELEHRIDKIPHRLLRQAINLLIERDRSDSAIRNISLTTLLKLADVSPPIAHELYKKRIKISNNAEAIAKFQGKQTYLRGEFFRYLQQNLGSICVVGNATTLVDRKMGDRIDAHKIIVRFNQYLSKHSRLEDTGSRIKIWVCSPRLARSIAGIPKSVDWVVLTGCDIRYQLANWNQLIPLLQSGKNIVTVPRDIWCELVQKLYAPPSAGILFLAWLIKKVGNLNQVAAIGFQKGDKFISEQQYHHSAPAWRPSYRHNWEGEMKLLNLWSSEGLAFLDRD
jgi:hypothetical protein